ncbi:MAG: ATP:cob(I)alamin adenosyltransferase [unclassified Hahellaceae]|nr:ATP:cob(I)alamin adenosyltransferase [Hahellaceae bacterium]|tara:strand:+ start:59646 stop:60212 length:567 start_codon:yes stop_codon:yes gene_type:complete
MGNRLSKIYTRTGDDGTTGLGNGDRIGKESVRVEAMGSVDETNSAIGMVVCELAQDDELRPMLLKVQNDLFDLGGELCLPGEQLIQMTHVSYLEEQIDTLNEQLPPLKNFILPGGNRAAAACHMARSLARRSERTLVILGRDEAIKAPLKQYINRLSDLLFVVARVLARRDPSIGAEGEILWQAPQRS